MPGSLQPFCSRCCRTKGRFSRSSRRIPRRKPIKTPYDALEIRPYQLVHLIAAIGAGKASDLGDAGLSGILASVRADPLRPVTLRCNVDSLFRYQNPGRADDSPGGEDFNDRRDLHVLQRMGLCPGDTRPAVTILEQVLASVDAGSVRDMECEDAAESSRWPRGRAVSADYEKGRQMGLRAIMAWRTEEEMARVKEESAEVTLAAGHLYIRPHHLMCMSCFYGRALNRNEDIAPITPDNLYEAIIAIHRNPEIPVTFIAGPCVICPPCGHLHPPTNLCIGGTAMGLRDQKKDLDVLRRLDMQYGDTQPARELYRRLYAGIASTKEICGYRTGVTTAPQWRVCGGPDGDPGYARARDEKLGITGL